MAISGSYDFTVTRDDIIQEALEQLGVLAEGETPSASQLTSAARTLNLVVKWWQSKNFNLFAIQKMYVLLEKNKREYSLGLTGDNCTTSFVATTLAANALTGAGTVDLTSATGISNGDYIGIQLDDGSMQWTTVNGVPVGVTITLTAVLTGDATAGNIVYAYTTKANRPMKIVNAILRNSSSRDLPLVQLARQEYVDLPDKYTVGTVNQIYHDPQLTNSKLYVWAVPEKVDEYLVLWTQKTLSDFDLATDNPEFPQEWYFPLAIILAKFSLSKYGVPRDTTSKIMAFAQEVEEAVMGFDTEDYLIIQPDFEG